MPIYSNIASTLARQGPKNLTHGYAQSLIAATHPQVYASQNRSGLGIYRTNKVGLLSSYRFQNAFHKSAQATCAVAQVRNEKCDGGLDAYFEAWKKTHVAGEPEKEWTQFQFAKSIEWKPTPSDIETEVLSEVETNVPVGSPHSGTPPNAKTEKDSCPSDLVTEDIEALAKIDAAIEKEIQLRKEEANLDDELNIVATQRSSQAPQILEELLNENKNDCSFISPNSKNSPDLQSHTYAEHLSKLSENKRFGEVPALFEAMLVAGVKPSVKAYNALLKAAIKIPTERIYVVPKALNVYSDMLRRRVLPDTTTYESLFDLLSSRTLEVNESMQILEKKRVRFGGMDVQGKFMFASSEVEYAILAEDNRIDLIIRLFDASTLSQNDRIYSPTTYDLLIAACSVAGHTAEMTRIYEHMRKSNVIPKASTFSHMINGVIKSGELNRAVDYYNAYKDMAIEQDNGIKTLPERQDLLVYASLLKAYIKSDRVPGALKFFDKIKQAYSSNTVMIDSVISEGLVNGMIERAMFAEAIEWAKDLPDPLKLTAMKNIATAAADAGSKSTAIMAFSYLSLSSPENIQLPTMAMLALSVREGDILAARNYWCILSQVNSNLTSSLIEPTAMFAVAMIGSGNVLDGLVSADQMFHRIRTLAVDTTGHLNDEIDEGITFINDFMIARGIQDPRQNILDISSIPNVALVPYQVAQPYEDSFDPYANTTDFKGSSIISDELERASGKRKGSKLNEALNRLKNIRRNGRHPRYIIYSKLISTAAREKRMDLVHEILGMARTDIPLLQQYSLVRYGWISILDAMVGACLTLGDRNLAAQYHQELINMGAAPTANTFGLYITTLKGCTKTFDEATDALKIFHLAKSEGVEPSSFLYNALIGKLGKARRIDDCLFYFTEMRSLGIRPTSVTYGTIVNALCRVSDEKLAEELFEEMESMPNYKARPAPYNSLMQFFLNTKRDKSKVLSYFERMKNKGIQPTSHTYKLLVDAHATLEPINMAAAEAVLDVIRSIGLQPEAVHYSSLIHARGCVMQDIEGSKAIFNSVMADPSIRPQACLYQALFESMVSNNSVSETESFVESMPRNGVEMTPYIANTLIHGWANEKNISKAEKIYATVRREDREPSTYEAMTRAYLAVDNSQSASNIIQEMLSRNYPSAVSGKIIELLGNNHAEVNA
ncbi:Pentatricopeptide repeat-containing protein [Golovinomyces cichoracearum]|uniref:Pentatricopeptide repeat-containing protein n=1 Tax=Golovinomyces cichoracearum TaxID=62708 RepID=A0A420I612_9PEZI|nr:Pentatricopeptide repeat-containing protein [Golovinomyces cichoracearum]